MLGHDDNESSEGRSVSVVFALRVTNPIALMTFLLQYINLIHGGDPYLLYYVISAAVEAYLLVPISIFLGWVNLGAA